MREWTILYGTRPEAVKLAPILREFRRRGHRFRLICSDQHTSLLADAATLDPAYGEAFHLQHPSEGDPVAYMRSLTALLAHAVQPNLPIIVQGDTATACAGAAVGLRAGGVYHVEAGVRTHQKDPWPEEQFRVWIDQYAAWGAAATPANQRNIPKDTSRFPVTGNPGIDQLYSTVQPTPERTDTVLITLHRRESHGPYLRSLALGLGALATAHPGLSFVWPVHPNPHVHAVTDALPRLRNLQLVDPLDPRTFTHLLATAHAVITDSGGVQEEAAALGIPALIARPHTDRPESVATGSALLLGPDPDHLVDLFPEVERLSREPNPCFGDGHAAPRILDHLETL